MSYEKKTFHNLGFDLVSLDKLVYFTLGPEEGGDTCQGGICTTSCTSGCSSCSPGNKN